MSWTTDLVGAVRGADMVIEAVPENTQMKLGVFEELSRLAPRQSILASNTSSIPIARLSQSVEAPERVLGLHFFSPVEKMPLVEIIATLQTSAETLEYAEWFCRRLGKETVNAPDQAGFVVNKLLVPYLLDAIRAVEAGETDERSIDQAMRLGCGHPRGPLELCDLIGLDVIVAVAERMHHEYGQPRYLPPPILRRMVDAGRHGKKSGRGFYSYDDTAPPHAALHPRLQSAMREVVLEVEGREESPT